MSKHTPLPKDWREGRRLRAWELYEQGWRQKDIAAALGVTEGAVSQWVSRGKSQGHRVSLVYVHIQNFCQVCHRH